MDIDPDREEVIIKQCERMNLPLPDRIANAPTLSQEMMFYYLAFLSLSSERPIGMGEGRIPITSILRYSRHYGLPPEVEHDLIFFVERLDSAYLKKRASKNG